MKFFYCFFIVIFTIWGGITATAENSKSMPQDVTWQVTVNNIDPIPQPSGFRIAYRVQMQCSALSENEASNTELRFPAQNLTSFTMPVLHPTIESFSFDDATDEWVVDFQEVIFAGTSIEFDIIAHSENHITPNGTTFSIDATVTSDNAAPASASDTGEWSATANLGMRKYLQFGPGTDALLDTPIKYYLYPCDPSFNPEAYGHLYIDNWVMMDILPEGTVYNSSSGTYDPNDHSVTWAGTEYIENEDCDFAGATDYWVEVTFPSSTFGPDSDPLVLSATNTATFQGYPIGDSGDTDNLQLGTDELLHSFVAPNSSGSQTKNASTPYAGIQDITYEGDSVEFHIAVRTSSSSSMPYYFKIIDPLPCLDYTPSVNTQYESPNLDDSACSNMAYQPNDYIQLALTYEYLTITDSYNFTLDNPTIPLGLVTTDGDTVSIAALFVKDYYGQLLYRVFWDEIQASLGAGVGVSSVIWDSETIDVRVATTPDDNAQAARLSLYGSVAEDTETYPMEDQYKVQNTSYFFVDAAGEDDLLGVAHDEVTIIRRAAIMEMSKTMFESTGLVTLTMKSNGESFTPTDSLIFTDLLPLGYTFESEAQRLFYLDGGNWYWASGQGDNNGTNYPELDAVSARNYTELEVIDDYKGTGRQLVRVTFLPPPVPNVWESMKTLRFSFYLEQQPMNYSAVNYFQVFPTNPVTAQNLLYQAGFSSSPVPAASSDPYDLDEDGKTEGDSFGEDNYIIIPSNTVVDIRSFKAVRGDLAAAEFEPFPAVAGITNQGGVADFQINIQNIGGIGLKDMVVYDILPHIGDTGLSETNISSSRGSTFDVTFTGMDMSTLPAGTVVEYSTSTNPCRNELTTGAGPFPTDCTNDWTTTIPNPIGDVKALRFTFPSGEISEFVPGEAFSIEYGVTYPTGVEPDNDVAWNNFAYAATRMDDDTEILPSEAPKVGLAMPTIDLALVKSVHPVNNFVGDTTEYTIVLDHEGNVTEDGVYTMPVGIAKDVILADDFLTQGLTIVPGTSTIINSSTNSNDGATFNETDGTITIPEIGPTDNYVITYLAYSNVAGSITNTVEVMSHPDIEDIDSTPGNGDSSEDDYSQATANWSSPAVQLQTLVETYSGSGVFIEADASDGLSGTYTSGQPINYQFVITNTGDYHLFNLNLTDNLIGFECNQEISVLPMGASTTINCTWQYGFSDSPNPYVNMATITGTAFADENQQTVSDSNPAQVVIAPCNLIIGTTENSPSCQNGADGSISITATNGTAPYDISWTGMTNGNLTGQNLPFLMDNLVSGTYSITIMDSNGCTTESTVVLASPLCASIGDYVWIDEDANGLQTDEGGVSGVTVTLLNHIGQIVASTSTDAYGYYLFNNLVAGDYQVQFTVPSNYVFTTMGTGTSDDSDVNPSTGFTNTISISEGENNRDIDAGLIYNENNSFSIGDFVWLDNGNGIQDVGEPGISGIIITLYNDADGSIASVTQTDESGHYQFTGVTPGSYYVDFANPVGYNFTTQTIGTDTGSDASPETGETTTFTIGSASISDIDAGFTIQPTGEASLGSTVWFDMNNNGIQDEGETGVSGVRVYLHATDGTVEVTTTNILGDYVFNGLVAGDYHVEFDISDYIGYDFVTPNAGTNDAIDSDVNDANGTNTTGKISIVSGMNDMSTDAGIYSAATATTSSLGDYLWYDENEDGIQDNGEVGVPGVTVVLHNNSGTVISTTITDKDGFYLFPNLADGDYEIVFENLPENYVFSPSNNPLGTSQTDSDANGFGSIAATISGGNNLDADAGIHMSIMGNATSSIGNMVFYDYNSNGLQDSGEIGIGAVTVYLYESSNTSSSINTTYTDGQGNYVFNDLPEGEYIVGFELPSAYQFTMSDVGNDDNKDSDILTTVGSIGYTDIIELPEGMDNLSVDAGMNHQQAGLGAIGDYVWFDGDNDGIQDSDEIGVGGITVTLFDNTGTFVSSTSTNSAGAYAFYGLADGDYTIRFTNFPAGMNLAQQTINTANGSDANPSTGLTHTITISGASYMMDIDAGLQGTVAMLGDYVWYDANANGLQDADESGISGATVTTSQNGGNISAITDENGFYSFQNLAPDSYTISIGTLSDGLTATIMGTGDAPNTDSNMNPSTGSTNAISLSAGDINTTVDAGYITPANGSLGNFAWFDNVNTDGLQGAGELGVSGMTICLYNDSGLLKGVAITDVDGYYMFNNLPPDDYSIEVSTCPADYVLTYQDATTEETGMDSDADRDLNTTANYAVNGNHLRNIDVGIAKLNIQGFVWYDADNNGLREASELLLEEVEVSVFRTDNTLVGKTFTNASGFYEFLEMDDDDYYVRFEASKNTAGILFISGTEPEVNGNIDISDANDSDMDPYTRKTPNFNLLLGETKRNIDAGFVTTALPVEMMYFEGTTDNCNNILDWATATEENNSHFIVEFSEDGKNFEALGRVEGNGNSTEVIDYTFTHKGVGKAYSYYRLQQFDFDGTSSYSEIIVLKADCETLDRTNIIAYPNPVISNVNIEVYNETTGKAELSIIDVSGRILKEMTFNLDAGFTTTEIDMSDYIYGVYMISVKVNGTENMIKVIKTN